MPSARAPRAAGRGGSTGCDRGAWRGDQRLTEAQRLGLVEVAHDTHPARRAEAEASAHGSLGTSLRMRCCRPARRRSGRDAPRWPAAGAQLPSGCALQAPATRRLDRGSRRRSRRVRACTYILARVWPQRRSSTVSRGRSASNDVPEVRPLRFSSASEFTSFLTRGRRKPQASRVPPRLNLAVRVPLQPAEVAPTRSGGSPMCTRRCSTKLARIDRRCRRCRSQSTSCSDERRRGRPVVGTRSHTHEARSRFAPNAQGTATALPVDAGPRARARLPGWAACPARSGYRSRSRSCRDDRSDRGRTRRGRRWRARDGNRRIPLQQR